MDFLAITHPAILRGEARRKDNACGSGFAVSVRSDSVLLTSGFP
jgi:hypothetical protein